MNENMNMENSQIRQNSIKWIMIALIGLVVILTGYILYDKFLINDTKPITKENNIKTNATAKTDNTTVNVDEVYKQFLNNIKTRKNAEIVSFRNVENYPNGYKHFILGTDNKLYVETFNDNDTKIPGAVGSGGDYTGKYINIDGVVRIFNTNHTPMDGGSYNGLLILKEDGSLYIMRNPENEEYKLEKIDAKNIVTAYDGISGSGTTFIVDILGNQFEIK